MFVTVCYNKSKKMHSRISEQVKKDGNHKIKL